MTTRWIAAALVLAAAARASADVPATAPELPRLGDARFTELRQMCRRAGQYRWAEPVIEMFEKAPAKDTWKTLAGVMEHKDGKLLVRSDQMHGMAYITRPMPAGLADAHGVRIEAWVQALPMNLQGQANMRMFQHSMFLGQGEPRIHQFDHQYFFASGPNGVSHQINSQLGGTHQAGQAGELKPGKLTHLVLEVLGPELRCKRDQSQTLVARLGAGTSRRIGPGDHLGLMCYSAEFAIVQMAYFRLDADPAAALTDADWKRTPFAGQSALTLYLLSQVVPAIDHSSYPARQSASELLAGLLPLSRPAIEAGLKARLSVEAQTRLQSLAGQSGPLHVPEDQPAAKIAPPKTEDLPFDEEEQEKKANNQPRPARRGQPATQPAR